MIELDEARAANLRKWNLGLTALHAAQAVLIVILASDFAIALTTTPPEGPPGTRLPAAETLVDVRIGAAIAIFLALAAIDHLVTATVARGTYENDLRNGINRFRWVEYSISATIMVLLIASYSGITEITAVIAIAGTNVAMILFGWLQEKFNPPGRTETTMMPFWFGTLAGVAPWIAIWFNVHHRGRGPGLRLRHRRGRDGLLLQLRSQPVAPVPQDRSLGRLPVRREDLPGPEPGARSRCWPGRSTAARWATEQASRSHEPALP